MVFGDECVSTNFAGTCCGFILRSGSRYLNHQIGTGAGIFFMFHVGAPISLKVALFYPPREAEITKFAGFYLTPADERIKWVIVP